MARWLSFLSIYNFVMHYKPGTTNILADALSHHPNCDPRSALRCQQIDDDKDDDQCAMCISLSLTRVFPESCLFVEIVATYITDTEVTLH